MASVKEIKLNPDKFDKEVLMCHIVDLQKENEELNNILSKMYSHCFQLKNDKIKFDLEKMLKYFEEWENLASKQKI